VLANYYLGLSYLGLKEVDKAKEQAKILEKLDPKKADELKSKLTAK